MKYYTHGLSEAGTRPALVAAIRLAMQRLGNYALAVQQFPSITEEFPELIRNGWKAYRALESELKRLENSDL